MSPLFRQVYLGSNGIDNLYMCICVFLVTLIYQSVCNDLAHL